MFRTTPRRRRMVAPVLIALAVGSLAACGDDDETSDSASGDTSTTTVADDGAAGSDVQTYCDAELALETVGEPDIDFEAMTPEEQADAAKSFASETLRPVADEVLAAAPDELDEHFAVLDAALTEVETTGDFSQFEGEEFITAEAAVHAFDLENCGWESVDASGIDYGFQGIPTSVPAGVVSFEFTNDSTHGEAHEFVVFKKNDGVTQSATELLQLPEEEAMTMASFTAATFAPPGESAYTVTELEAGDYFVACFIPVGATEENQEGTGPPHFMQGMVTEFSVE
jgi:uncharacterized cupredoxin-like copper-binding protein